MGQECLRETLPLAGLPNPQMHRGGAFCLSELLFLSACSSSSIVQDNIESELLTLIVPFCAT
jgi:hypothetical protein